MVFNKNKNRVFSFNRRVQQKTDYRKRLNLLKGNMTRIVIRKSNNNTLVQFVDYVVNGDKIITGTKSNVLSSKYGSKLHSGNLPSAYLTGYLAGKTFLKDKKNKDVECIFDIGLQKKIYGNRIFSALKGVLDSGVKVRVSEIIFPKEERITGEHTKNKDAKKNFEDIKKKIGDIK